jgi:hypothetical protein
MLPASRRTKDLEEAKFEKLSTYCGCGMYEKGMLELSWFVRSSIFEGLTFGGFYCN